MGKTLANWDDKQLAVKDILSTNRNLSSREVLRFATFTHYVS